MGWARILGALFSDDFEIRWRIGKWFRRIGKGLRRQWIGLVGRKWNSVHVTAPQ